MAIVGWVLGLTYVEFCVIGNIWIPCAAIIGTALFLIYASFGCLKLRPGSIRILTVGTILFAVLQIVMSILLLYHYAGTMHDAFFRCVHDLRYLAAIAHTSYEAVNIFLWVFVGVSLLTFNITMSRYLMKRGS